MVRMIRMVVRLWVAVGLAVAVVVLAVITSGAGIPPAAAQGPNPPVPAPPPTRPPVSVTLAPGEPEACAEALVDDAGVLADPEGVATAARGLAASSGAVVRVRVVASLDGHDAETHRGLLEAPCPSWRWGSVRHPQLLLVMVAPVERQTTVTYGRAWTTRLAPVVADLQRQHMDAHFREGDVDAGLRDGLDALGVVLQGPEPVTIPSFVTAPFLSATPPPRITSGFYFPVAAFLFLAVVGAVITVSLRQPRRPGPPPGWSSGSGGPGAHHSSGWWGGGQDPDRYGGGNGWYGGSGWSGGSDSGSSGGFDGGSSGGFDSGSSGGFDSGSSSSGGDGGSSTTSW